jgi:hypothetical protein
MFNRTIIVMASRVAQGPRLFGDGFATAVLPGAGTVVGRGTLVCQTAMVAICMFSWRLRVLTQSINQLHFF